MKQKLTRALIDEIRKEMPVLSQNEEKGVIGGTLYVIGVVAFFDARISNSPTRTHPAVGSLFTIRIALIFSLVVKFTV